RAGIETHLLDTEALDAGAFDRATRRLPAVAENRTAFYRGWMMAHAAYAALYDALARRRVILVNNAEQYRHVHHLPESYSVIRECTPKSVWTASGPRFDLEEVMDLLATFGDAPVVVKDYVKSQKHYWDEACFIPSARDREAVRRVTTRFAELQG